MELFLAKVHCILLILFGLNVHVCTAQNITKDLADPNLKSFALANNDMAVRLYEKLVSGTQSNVFFSPLSLSACFGMLLLGSKGGTEKELRSVLGYEKVHLSNEQVHTAFQSFQSTKLSSNNPESKTHTFKLVNKILIQEELGLIPTFERLVRNFYKVSVQQVDFQKDSRMLVLRINSWVKDNTNGKIKSILQEINPNSLMLILNAVYFKSTWKTLFPKDKTKLQTFYNVGLVSEARKVPFMNVKAKFRYGLMNDVQLLELPYARHSFSMVVLLPSERNGLSALENSFLKEKLSNIRKQMFLTNVIVSLPKFKIQYSKDLTSDFQALGMESVFNPALADFSGMIKTKNASVSQIKHRALIEVNEEGSEAAAATSMSVVRIMLPIVPLRIPEFKADHPFVFLIVDRETDMILFVGRVNKL